MFMICEGGNHRMGLEVGVNRGTSGAFLKNIGHVDADEADAAGGDKAVAQELDVEVHAVRHGALLQGQRDGGVPDGVGAMGALHVRRGGHPHAGLYPRHCVHRHLAGAHLLQPRRRVQHHVQLPRLLHIFAPPPLRIPPSQKNSTTLQTMGSKWAPNGVPNPHPLPDHPKLALFTTKGTPFRSSYQQPFFNLHKVFKIFNHCTHRT